MLNLKRTIRYQAAILDHDRMLMLLIDDAFSGSTFWAIPGGGREGAESEEACVRREVAEETSLDVTVGRLLLSQSTPDDLIYQGAKTYLCTIVSGTARPGSEPEVDTPEHSAIRAIGWFDLRDPASWPALAKEDPIAASLLRQIRGVLGYDGASAGFPPSSRPIPVS